MDGKETAECLIDQTIENADFFRVGRSEVMNLTFADGRRLVVEAKLGRDEAGHCYGYLEGMECSPNG